MSRDSHFPKTVQTTESLARVFLWLRTYITHTFVRCGRKTHALNHPLGNLAVRSKAQDIVNNCKRKTLYSWSIPNVRNRRNTIKPL